MGRFERRPVKNTLSSSLIDQFNMQPHEQTAEMKNQSANCCSASNHSRQLGGSDRAEEFGGIAAFPGKKC